MLSPFDVLRKLVLIRKETAGYRIQGAAGEDNAVIQGLVEATLSHFGAPSDLLARAFD